MEKEKALAIKENLVLETNQNLLVKEDLKYHQETEKEKALAIKEKIVSLKKTTQTQLVLQIIQNTLEKKHLKAHQLMEREKAPV
jgi:hypothetical protein